jgi:hypothetical protein
MGIPRIYRDVVTQIVSNHLAIESALIKRIKARSLAPETTQFASRLKAVKTDLGAAGNDWSIIACRKLNKVRNKCAHIDDADYQSLEVRLLEPTDDFVTFVKLHNPKLGAHKMSDFEWASTMTYQRIYKILGLDYDPLVLGRYASLPPEMGQLFLPQNV